jgi:hypothetical protein
MRQAVNNTGMHSGLILLKGPQFGPEADLAAKPHGFRYQ